MFQKISSCLFCLLISQIAFSKATFLGMVLPTPRTSAVINIGGAKGGLG